jgi:hypothetical protein
MKKQLMQVDVMGEIVFSSTQNGVDLISLCAAGNVWRLKNGMAVYQIDKFLKSKYLPQYIKAAAIEWDLPEESFLKKTGTFKNTKHYGHVSVAVLLAEQISPAFHAKVHKTFIDGKILEYRLMAGDEYKNLNNAIAQYLPSPSGDNTGRVINAAKMIRAKCNITNSPDKEISTWNQFVADSVAQRMRYDLEAKLVSFISLGLIRDWEHLKDVIDKL